jgi:hypothetical protein
MDRAGEAAPLAVTGWSFVKLIDGRFDVPAASQYFALGYSQSGTTAAVALDDQFQEAWNYPIPAEAFQGTSDPLAAGKLLPNGVPTWVIAGADGIVHTIAHDGSVADNFCLGKRIAGITVAELNQQPALLLSSGKSVEAFLLSPLQRTDP